VDSPLGLLGIRGLDLANPLALPEMDGRFGNPSSSKSEFAFRSATRRAQTARRNSLAYRLGMDYLLVVHDQTLITLVRPKGFRPSGARSGV
jgi:hypothetical protein